MVRLAAQLRCVLEEVTDLDITKDYRFNLDVKCTQCGTEHQNVWLSPADEKEPLPTGRGEANLVMKCKFCRRDFSMELVDAKRSPVTGPGFHTLATIDCRGVEPTKWNIDDGFECRSAESDTRFEVQFEDGEWSEFDEEAQKPVQITEVETRFVNVKA